MQPGWGHWPGTPTSFQGWFLVLLNDSYFDPPPIKLKMLWFMYHKLLERENLSEVGNLCHYKSVYSIIKCHLFENYADYFHKHLLTVWNSKLNLNLFSSVMA